MSSRLSKTRQEPLDPDEIFSALVTRLIITNRAERATRDHAVLTKPLSLPKPRRDSTGEPRSGAGAA